MFKKYPIKSKITQYLSNFTLLFTILWGLYMVLMPIRPFQDDEMRIIYNLKFKTPAALMGQLDYMQQFPRVYLELVKWFTSFFKYSYLSLRTPSFIVGLCTIALAYKVMQQIYCKTNFCRLLFVMILVSSYTFTEYFVQVKHYTMELFLSLLAIWQFLKLLKINPLYELNKTYVILCFSFLIAPFFSYTYPIAICPVYIIMFLRCLKILAEKQNRESIYTVFKIGVPLMVGMCSIILFYFLDVQQLMADKNMHKFWSYEMMENGFNWYTLLVQNYNLFSQVGAGLVFNILFGVLGLCGLCLGIYSGVLYIRRRNMSLNDMLTVYSAGVILILIFLFIAGKFPLGEQRLCGFTVPAIAILIIGLLDRLNRHRFTMNFSKVVAVVLFLGVNGNIYTTFAACLSGDMYAKRLKIYVATEKAIMLAQSKNIPILVTPGVAFPYDTTNNLPFTTKVPGDWVLKTFPAYKVEQQIKVIGISKTDSVKDIVNQLSINADAVLAGNGLDYEVIAL